MVFTYNKFLKSLEIYDKVITILDDDGNIIHTLNPFDIYETKISDKYLELSMRNDEILSLEFHNMNEVKLAKPLLDAQIDAIKTGSPYNELKQTRKFSWDKYLRELANDDRFIQVIDDDAIPVYSINPYAVIHPRVLNNFVDVEMKGSKNITIPFSSNFEAKLALERFQIQLDILRQRLPYNIDKEIENYIEGKLIFLGIYPSTWGITIVGKTHSADVPIVNIQDDLHNDVFVLTSEGNLTINNLTLANIGATSGLINYLVVDDDGNVWYQTTGIQGNQGFQGFQGWQGWQGFQGLQGTDGYIGEQGSQGVQGVQGFQGWQGFQGLQGTDGYIGEQGPQGFQGNQGSQGWQGLQGLQGTDGYIGEQGFQGFQGNQGFQGWQGLQGLQGFQGRQGLQGNQGWQGLQGNQGFQGVSGSITFTFEVVGITGSQGFQGSQGYQGNQGSQGNQGTQGFQGLQGFQGATGCQGEQGWQGNQGWQGYQGLQGYQGFGEQGWQGNQGFQGEEGFQGFQGEQGFQGFQGAEGFQGFQGEQGFQGFQGDEGFQGYQGYQGEQGWQGYQGEQGWQGYQGEGSQGYQGEEGFQGFQGDQGFQGFQGDQGWQGFQGEQGWQGFQGEQGFQGWQGTTGSFTGYVLHRISGSFSGLSMSASPTYYYDIFFPSSFTYSYVVNIESDAVRTFTITNKTLSGFRIESNSITPILDIIYWEANDLTIGDFGAFVGLQGPTGLNGSGTGGAGYQGDVGPQGFQGIIGLQGPTGSGNGTGSQGFQGYQGPQGLIGNQGFQGITGPGFNAISSPASGRVLTATGSSTTSAIAQPNLTYDGSLLTLTASNFQLTSGQSWTTLKSNGNTTASVTIDLNNGNVQSYSLNANTTFSFSNGKAGGTYIILLTQGPSSFTASFASSKWSGGIPPIITTTNNAVDIFTFIYDGTTFYGSYLQNY